MTPWTVGTGWTLVGIAVAWVIAAGVVRLRTKNTRPAATTPAPAAGSGQTKCETTGCGYAACSIVVEHADLGGGTRLVCKGCCDEGEAHGWWRWIGDLRSKAVAA
jgi:hypothetical protein